MSQRLSTVLLSAGLFFGTTPAASAVFDVEHSGHGRSCWFYDDDRGWYRTRCGGHHGRGHGHDGYYDRDRDSAHGSGDYDHHRDHER
jgi:hypothetical protein